MMTGSKKKLAWTFVQMIDNKPIHISRRNRGRSGARSAIHKAASKKSHPKTCGLASQWTFVVESMGTANSQPRRKSPPTAQVSCHHIQVAKAIAAAYRTAIPG